jgi:hypothetical protein
MAEPTLKDVLNAVAEVRTEVRAIRGDTKSLRGEVNSLRSEMNKRFDDLDEELTTHASVHRRLEKDVTSLKARPTRAATRAPRRR